MISRKSLGGIQTDLQCRVLDGGGIPLGGLYAVGEAAGFGGGGMNGKRGLEGTFLGIVQEGQGTLNAHPYGATTTRAEPVVAYDAPISGFCT